MRLLSVSLLITSSACAAPISLTSYGTFQTTSTSCFIEGPDDGYSGGQSDPLCRGFQPDLGIDDVRGEYLVSGEIHQEEDGNYVGGLTAYLGYNPNLRIFGEYRTFSTATFDVSIPVTANIPGSGLARLRVSEDYGWGNIHPAVVSFPTFQLGTDSTVAIIIISGTTDLLGLQNRDYEWMEGATDYTLRVENVAEINRLARVAPLIIEIPEPSAIFLVAPVLLLLLYKHRSYRTRIVAVVDHSASRHCRRAG